MSAAKYTPAPWWPTDSGVRDAGGYICFTNPPTRYEGQDERFKRETAERAANKLLIAAAPELLEALKDVVRIAEAASIGVTGNKKRVERARAAIAKATGSAS